MCYEAISFLVFTIIYIVSTQCSQYLLVLNVCVSAGHGGRPGVLQRHVQMFRTRRRPRSLGLRGVKGDYSQ